MSEMIDRVAEAIAKAERHESDAMYADMARAAIEAMREPTKEMEAAYLAACDKSGACLWRTAYRVLIDAALSAPSTSAPSS